MDYEIKLCDPRVSASDSDHSRHAEVQGRKPHPIRHANQGANSLHPRIPRTHSTFTEKIQVRQRCIPLMRPSDRTNGE